MIIDRHAWAILLIPCALISLTITTSTSFIVCNVYATVMADNSNIRLSSSFTNGSDDVNQSSMDMTMMKMMERGEVAMSFNQNKISHQFVGTPVGGVIIITALNSSDIVTIGQIKNHIMDIEKEFSEGNFTKPFFIHVQEVPGIKLMSEKKDLIEYEILQMNNGSRLILSAKDKEIIDAIHQFMEFQAREHLGH